MVLRLNVGGKVVDRVDLIRKKKWPWRLDVLPFAVLYAIWMVTIVPSIDIVDALIVLGGLVSIHVLTLLFTAWSIDFKCFVQHSKVNDIYAADSCKVTPAKFSGSKEVVPLHIRQQGKKKLRDDRSEEVNCNRISFISVTDSRLRREVLGLLRCGKSCRLRWINYLRPDLKRANFSDEEDELIINLHSLLGNKWSLIAARLPERTDNEIKNYWNTHIKRKLFSRGIDPQTHRPLNSTTTTTSSTTTNSTNNKNSNMGTKRITNFKREEQNYSLVQVQPELITMSNIIKVGGSSDSAEDSNSSSGVTTELEVYPKHKLNLELSIGLPCQPQPSSINDLNDSKQANQRHQEQVVSHQSFRTSATPFSSAPAVVHRTACLCTYNRGFKKSVTADSQYRFYRPLDA